MSGWTAWRDVAAGEREAWESRLEPLVGQGLVVTSRELSHAGPWRIEIFGQGDRQGVEAALGAGWQWEELPAKDWVAENQRSFQPFAVGPFWVHPSHATIAPPAKAIPLRIDAGMAFGTGTHATTRGCLHMLSTLPPGQAENAVDVGCGSGILAIAMAKLWRKPVIGSDNDAEAVDVARENASLNGVAALCQFVLAKGLEAAALQARAPYDLIVANILAGPLIELSTAFAAAVKSRGHLLLSGLLVDQADDILALYGRRGFARAGFVDLETGGVGWRTLLLQRRA